MLVCARARVFVGVFRGNRLTATYLPIQGCELLVVLTRLTRSTLKFVDRYFNGFAWHHHKSTSPFTFGCLPNRRLIIIMLLQMFLNTCKWNKPQASVKRVFDFIKRLKKVFFFSFFPGVPKGAKLIQQKDYRKCAIDFDLETNLIVDFYFLLLYLIVFFFTYFKASFQ